MKLGKQIMSLVLALVMVLGSSSGFTAAAQSEEVFETESMISAGGSQTLALKSDGSVWSWGWVKGTIYATEAEKEKALYNVVPVQVTDLTDIIAVSVGYYHSLALKYDGTVWAWGSNGYGQLGNGTSGEDEYSRVPVQVKGLTDVVTITAGDYHSLAVKSDGTVWAWGANGYGQLGNSTTGDSNVPVQVTGLSDVTTISAGFSHTLALKRDGTVWAWGHDYYGQLGNGISGQDANKSVPVQVTRLSNVTSISAGGSNSLAVKSDGTVWAWGDNIEGRLGNGESGEEASSSIPVQVTGLTDVKEVSAGGDHSLALKSNGTVWAWGSNIFGGLGDDTLAVIGAFSSVPVQVKGLTDGIAVSAGDSHSMGMKSNGTVWTWGHNSFGQLGIGTYGYYKGTNVPVQVLGENGKGYLNLDAASINFYDITGNSWYYNAVQYSAQNDLMVGTSDTTFEPYTNMTRSMVAVVLYKMEGTPDVSGTDSFADVTGGGWYTDAVNWAYEKKVISGYGDGNFGPSDNISREQFATMMRNYAEYKGMDISGETDLSTYADMGNISSWATDAMKWAVQSKLITGISETVLDPLGTATRAQCAAILMNWMVNIAA